MTEDISSSGEFIVPNYSGKCLSNLMPAIYANLSRSQALNGFPWSQNVGDVLKKECPRIVERRDILPADLEDSDCVVLLVLDGLGSTQLVPRLDDLPNMRSLSRDVFHSVAPTTTACALTSLTTGLPPSKHGLVGYRMRVGSAAVLNTLKWGPDKDRTINVPEPKVIQPNEPFYGFRPMVVTKAIFDNTGFTKAHLRNVRTRYWRTLSGIVSAVRDLQKDGEKLIYLYYEGLDTTAHEFGLGEHFNFELEFVDYLIGRLREVLTPNSSLMITADHGQVEVLDPPIHMHPEILSKVLYQSGEGRFRWLHVKAGSTDVVCKLAKELYGDVARVFSREEILANGVLGTDMSPDVALRLGDVAIVATKPVAFFDPNDTGPFDLVCRHGALTKDEVEVPLLYARGA